MVYRFVLTALHSNACHCKAPQTPSDEMEPMKWNIINEGTRGQGKENTVNSSKFLIIPTGIHIKRASVSGIPS